MRSRVKRDDDIAAVIGHGAIAVPPRGRRTFAGQRIPEHAGRFVATRVHGAIVDGHTRPAVRGGRRVPVQRRRVPRPVIGTRFRFGGHRCAARRPAVRSGRPGHRPSSCRRHRTERRGRGGRAGQRTRVAVVACAAQMHGRRHAATPVRRRQVFRNEIVSLRRDRLHGFPAVTGEQLVVGRPGGLRSPGVRPLGKTSPVHGHTVGGQRFGRRRWPKFPGGRHHRCDRSSAVNGFVRLPAHIDRTIVLNPVRTRKGTSCCRFQGEISRLRIKG